MNWRMVVPILSIVVCGCVAKVEQPARTQTAPAVNANDPCSWLSERDASTALGQRVRKTASPAPTYCRYAAPATTGESTALEITFTVDTDLNAYDKFVQRDDAAMIAGLGDRAVWNTGGNSVCAIKGSRRLILNIADGKSPSTITEPELQQKAVAAAQKIVERM